MAHKLALAAALLVAVFARNALATPGWQNSPGIQSVASCGPGTATQIGYYADPGISPRTGDVNYIRIAAVAGCAYDTVGFDLSLPAGVTPAVSAQNPVYCFRGVGSAYSQIPNDSNGACSQTAQTGNFGGLFYGWSNLTPGQWFEIQVPVRYTKPAPGNATAYLTSVIATLTPTIALNVVYSAGFSTFAGASSTDGTSANVGFELDNYYVAGQLVIDYGVGTFDHSTAPANVPATSPSFPNVTANLPGTTPGTTLSWRVRFITAYGTFTSATQTIVMNYPSLGSPPPVVRCWRGHPC